VGPAGGRLNELLAKWFLSQRDCRSGLARGGVDYGLGQRAGPYGHFLELDLTGAEGGCPFVFDECGSRNVHQSFSCATCWQGRVRELIARWGMD